MSITAKHRYTYSQDQLLTIISDFLKVLHASHNFTYKPSENEICLSLSVQLDRPSVKVIISNFEATFEPLIEGWNFRLSAGKVEW